MPTFTRAEKETLISQFLSLSPAEAKLRAAYVFAFSKGPGGTNLMWEALEQTLSDAPPPGEVH